ncbi:MAG: lipoprotein [Gammaproteobacteria bacterium]|nr:lipoprotein [Gammaproteobacteria bacterium]
MKYLQVLMLILLMTACGQKGPLFLPDEEETNVTENYPAADREKELL